MTLELEKSLPADVYERLRLEAERLNEPLDAFIVGVLESYANTLSDDSSADAAAGFEEGWRDIKAGRTTPADEAIVELVAQRAARQKKHDKNEG